ncbi:MAG: Lrp/AsnC family transcriptional regulator [Neisseria sp.]|nr:Lrp/AsnC family transcriptional regulator [Neisseria sp.]
MPILDKLNRQILNQLQDDAAVSLKELAARVHSSVATCQRRIRALQENGVIVKQVALVSPPAVGRQISVFVMVEMMSQNPAQQEYFEQQMRREADVMSCYEISGDYDFVLLVHAADMPAYHAFTRRVLNSDNNVRNFKSQFVMNFAKAESKIVL